MREDASLSEGATLRRPGHALGPLRSGMGFCTAPTDVCWYRVAGFFNFTNGSRAAKEEDYEEQFLPRYACFREPLHFRMWLCMSDRQLDQYHFPLHCISSRSLHFLSATHAFHNVALLERKAA